MIDLQEYIGATITKIQSGLGQNGKLGGIIVLELSTITESKSGGGIDIKVVEFGNEVASQQIQKITIPLTLKSSADNLEEEVRIKKAQEGIAKSEAAIAVSKIIKQQHEYG